MTLDEYDRRMEEARGWREESERLLSRADGIEIQTQLDAGIGCTMHTNGYYHNDLPGYYKTPREVVEALEAKR